MIRFHIQKTLSLDFMINSVSLCHCVSAKIFVEYPSFCFFWSVLATEAATTRVLLKGVCNNFANFTGKHLYWSLFLKKLQAWRSETLLKQKLHHSCFRVNIKKKFKNTFSMEYLRWLLLKIIEEFLRNSNLTWKGFIKKNL